MSMAVDHLNGEASHHFPDAQTEFEASKLGIWLFLCTEILMFGGLFVAYFIFHSLYPEAFMEGAKYTDWKLGAANTVVLLFSSLTIALAVHFLQKNNIKAAAVNLAITFGCAMIFMVIKAIEYSHKIHDGLLPGRWFSHAKETAELPTYFAIYFTTTGVHGLHVLIGMGLIAWVFIRTIRGGFNSRYYTAVEGVALYWHLVDLVWIFLFPLLYLV